MTAGILQIYHSRDPCTTTTATSTPANAAGPEPRATTFTDALVRDPAQPISAAWLFQAIDDQPFPPPNGIDMDEAPFLSVYDVADVEAAAKSKAFGERVKEVVGEARSEVEGLGPRLYREIMVFEKEGMGGVSQPLNSYRVYTAVSRIPDPPAFWSWLRDEMTPAFMEGPEFLRSRVFELVPDFSIPPPSPPSSSSPSSSSSPAAKTSKKEESESREKVYKPYIFTYEFVSEEFPWSDAVEVAGTKGYQKHIESEDGLLWQSLHYWLRGTGVGGSRG